MAVQISNHIEFINNVVGYEYPQYAQQEEKLARGLVVLYDYLGTQVVVSDLDCTETSDHTIGITGKEKLKQSNPDIIFSSQAIRMLFPLLKKYLGMFNYTMTLQGQKVADQVVNLGYEQGVFDDVIGGGKYLAYVRDEQGDPVWKSDGEAMEPSNSDQKKQYKVEDISKKKNIPLHLFAFLSDADLHLTT